MKQMSIGREPDFLMKLDQVEMMHAVSVQITDQSSQRQNIKIVDRSLFTACLKVKDLLNAKSHSHLWTISRIGSCSEEYRITSNSIDAHIFIYFPSQLGSDIRDNLSEKFLDNLRKFSK